MQRTNQPAFIKRYRLAALAVAALAVSSIFAQPAAADDDVRFDMVRSAALNAIPGCVPNATAHVSIEPDDSAERMIVKVEGLPPKTDFDFFVLQIPHAPFGMAWYQGDIETNGAGKGRAEFVGRFNVESFIVAPGS